MSDCRLTGIFMKVTFFESVMDAESIAPLLEQFETCHVLTIITRAITLLKNIELSPFDDLQKM